MVVLAREFCSHRGMQVDVAKTHTVVFYVPNVHVST
jgi:hypothetical protein